MRNLSKIKTNYRFNNYLDKIRTYKKLNVLLTVENIKYPTVLFYF